MMTKDGEGGRGVSPKMTKDDKGGSQKMTKDDRGGGGLKKTKLADIICEQPLNQKYKIGEN